MEIFQQKSIFEANQSFSDDLDVSISISSMNSKIMEKDPYLFNKYNRRFIERSKIYN